MDYSRDFEAELYKEPFISKSTDENYKSMIEQCLFSIRLNKKIIEVNSLGNLNFNKILVNEARIAITETQDAIQIFANKIS